MTLRAFHHSRREHARLLPFPSARRREAPSASTATLLAHRIPPWHQLRAPHLDESIERRLYVVEQHRADHCAGFLFGRREGEKLRLEMSARHRIALTPAHEQQVCAKWTVLLIAHVGDDLDAVRSTVAALEGGRPVVHGHVPAKGIGVAL